MVNVTMEIHFQVVIAPPNLIKALYSLLMTWQLVFPISSNLLSRPVRKRKGREQADQTAYTSLPISGLEYSSMLGNHS